jgi:putative DNA primase/helicase
MGVTGKSFKEIAKELDPDSVTAAIPKPPPKTSVLIDAIASKCRLLTEGDSVLTYLGNRGINVVPESVRMAANLKHYHDGKTAFFDAMVARISDPDGKRMGFHVTWLKDGLKAPVDVSRKIYKQGETINGGGVYLGPVREEMVIGEGIETTLAGMQLINASGIAALNAGQMTKIQLPDAVKAVVILADNDSRFTGQKAAYTLASRLFAEGWSVRVVVPSEPDTDFADQL